MNIPALTLPRKPEFDLLFPNSLVIPHLEYWLKIEKQHFITNALSTTYMLPPSFRDLPLRVLCRLQLVAGSTALGPASTAYTQAPPALPPCAEITGAVQLRWDTGEPLTDLCFGPCPVSMRKSSSLGFLHHLIPQWPLACFLLKIRSSWMTKINKQVVSGDL